MAKLASAHHAAVNAEDLARLAQAGSADAFTALMQQFAKPLDRYLRQRCPNPADAEDLLQEVMLRTWQKLATWDSARPFAPWLFTLARNYASSQYRNRSSKNLAALDIDLPCSAPDPAARLIQQQTHHDLWAAARRVLNDRQFHALHLRYVRDMSVRDIAHAMNMTQTHVKVALFRARKKLIKTCALPNSTSTERT